MTEQPGYDALASAYDSAFPAGYAGAAERLATSLFAQALAELPSPNRALDVGCGAGHVAADLQSQGLDVLGMDPSASMLALARQRYPDMSWLQGDAGLSALDAGSKFTGILARYSLIHIEPQTLPGVLSNWTKHLRRGALVLVAFQCEDDEEVPVSEFDHRVQRAWRWQPDAMAQQLKNAGFSERWRLITQPDDQHRFAECHLMFAW